MKEGLGSGIQTGGRDAGKKGKSGPVVTRNDYLAEAASLEEIYVARKLATGATGKKAPGEFSLQHQNISNNFDHRWNKQQIIERRHRLEFRLAVIEAVYGKAGRNAAMKDVRKATANGLARGGRDMKISPLIVAASQAKKAIPSPANYATALEKIATLAAGRPVRVLADGEGSIPGIGPGR